MSDAEFKAGDIVVLKTGDGPRMVVRSAGADVLVDWASGNSLKKATLPATSLMPVEEPSIDDRDRVSALFSMKAKAGLSGRLAALLDQSDTDPAQAMLDLDKFTAEELETRYTLVEKAMGGPNPSQRF